MRKITLAIATAGAAAMTVTGCGSSSGGGGTGSSGGGAATSSQATSAGKPEAVSSKHPKRDAHADLVIWTDATHAPVVSSLAKTFATTNGIKVAVQVSTDVRANYETAFKAGQAPDVIVGAHDWLGELVANGAVAPLRIPDDVAKDFKPKAIKATTFGGQTYAVPYGVENLALVRNTDLAPKAPKTMDDLVKTGTSLVKKGKASNVLAVAMGKKGDAYHGFPFLSACGGGIFGAKANGDYDPDKVIVDSPGSLKGAEVMADLGQKKVLSTNIDTTNADSLFANGKVPYEITGPWSINAFKKAGINYSIDPLPTISGCGKMKSFLGVQMFYVSSKAKNATIAKTFVTDFVTKKASQEALFKIGHRPPAHTAAYRDVVKNNPEVAAWAKAAKGGQLMPNIPAMNAVWTPLGQAMADIISGKTAPDAAMKKAQKAIVAAIDSAD